MTFLADLISGLYFLARGTIDALLGRRRQRYVTIFDIKAPVDTVWAATSAQEIVFEGPPRIEITSAPRPGTIDVYDGVMRVGDHIVPMAYREIEKKPGEGIVLEILRDGSDPSVAPGEDYYVTCTVAEQPGGTRLTMVHELTHNGFLGRVAVPLGAIHNGRRLRDHCEAEVGTAPESGSNRLGGALLTGALTYASFIYLTDWKFAAMLLLLLLIHEAGHALAMRSVGLPVQGIYFVPFMGGVAVSAAPHRSEAERGYVALMGPGFSLLPTAFFLAAAHVTGETLFHQLALVSAILNGFNLAPVLPLDGGHVVDAALSRADPDMAAIFNMLALMAGIGASVYLGWHILTVLLLLAAPMALRSGKQPRRVESISVAGRNWLIAGYLATIAFYAAVVAHLLA